MPRLAGALTGLGLLALPAVPSPTYRLAQPLTDTWSLQASVESGAVIVNAAIAGTDSWSLTFGAESGAVSIASPVTGSDTWSASFTDSSLLTTYPRERTQLSLLALPGKYGLITAKAVTSTQNVNVTDSWFISWTETPTDSIYIETTDTWRLSLADSSSLSVSQTFAASDSWALNWQDVGSVFAGGPIFLALTDTWSLSIVDAAIVAATTTASDTWLISITDSSSISVESDDKTGSDTWSLAFTLETGFFSPVVEIPIIASDEWRIVLAEVSEVIRLTLTSPGRRQIHVTGPNRVIDT